MKKIPIIVLFILVLTSSLRSQNTLSGKIVNSKTNQAIHGAIIYIPELKTTALADTSGLYIIKNFPKGNYLLEVSLLGYKSQVKEINIKESATEDFKLIPSNMELTEVIITGVSSATEKNSNPIPISIVTHKDFLESSSTNIIDGLARKPGISQITIGASISKPVIRGLGYNRVVVMNDGIRQEGQQWGDEFGIEVDEYSVNKVEILKGPASLAYGSDAMAGVINMLAAPPLPDGKIKGALLSNYQTNNGLIGNSINLAGNLKGISWDVRYSNKMAHAYQNKYDGYVWNSGFSESDIKGTLGINRKWGYSRLTISSFDLKLGIIEGARDSATGKFIKHILGSMSSDSLAIVPYNAYTSYSNNYSHIHQHIRHHKVVLDNNFAIGNGHLKLTLGLQENYRQEANDITKGDVYNNSFYLNTMNYNLQYVLPELNHLEVSVGLNGMKQNSQNRGTVFLVPEYNLFDVGAFVTAMKTIKKLSISGGFRYQLRNLKGNDFYTDSSGAKVMAPTSGSIHRFAAYNSNFTGIAGSFGMAYDFSENIYGKLNISRGFRAPNIAESGSNGVHDGTVFYEIGDPNLKPETSTQIDVTVGANTENVTVELNGFYNNISNYIFASKLKSKLGGDSINFDPNSGLTAATSFKYVSSNALLYGGEAVLNIHPNKLRWLAFENSFSMVNAIQEDQPDSSKYLPYTPPYKLLSQLVIKFNTKGNLFKNTYLKAGIDNYFTQDKVYHKFGNETTTPGYTLINIGLGSDICKKGTTLFSFYIFANNITDVAYQSNMSRLKYADVNNTTGRTGVYNMGRNLSFKLLIPLNFKN